MTKHPSGRAGRKEQVRNLLKSENRLLTSYELAKAIGLKPSHYSRAIFCEMYNEGEINGCSLPLKNGKTVFYFCDKSIDCNEQLRMVGF